MKLISSSPGMSDSSLEDFVELDLEVEQEDALSDEGFVEVEGLVEKSLKERLEDFFLPREGHLSRSELWPAGEDDLASSLILFLPTPIRDLPEQEELILPSPVEEKESATVPAASVEQLDDIDDWLVMGECTISPPQTQATQGPPGEAMREGFSKFRNFLTKALTLPPTPAPSIRPVAREVANPVTLSTSPRKESRAPPPEKCHFLQCTRTVGLERCYK